MTTSTKTPADIESLTLKITQEIRVKAPIDVTFAALLEKMGPANEKPDGTPMPFKIESKKPGAGAGSAISGDGNAHRWGTVQGGIKRPDLA